MFGKRKQESAESRITSLPSLPAHPGLTQPQPEPALVSAHTELALRKSLLPSLCPHIHSDALTHMCSHTHTPTLMLVPTPSHTHTQTHMHSHTLVRSHTLPPTAPLILSKSLAPQYPFAHELLDNAGSRPICGAPATGHVLC